jgi:hypothetical protein
MGNAREISKVFDLLQYSATLMVSRQRRHLRIIFIPFDVLYKLLYKRTYS